MSRNTAIDIFRCLSPAGTATLSCYMIPYAYYSILPMLYLAYSNWMITGGLGVFKSVIVSFLLVLFAGCLQRSGIQLKL